MNADARATNKGFTIIEVVLVLAVAGLIFLVVFLALRSGLVMARDNQRKQDLSQLVGAVHQWRTNHLGGNLDTDVELQNVANQYFIGHNNPLTGQSYSLLFYDDNVAHISVVAPTPNQISYVAGHICGSDSGTSTLVTEDPGFVHGIRQFAALITLENNTAYCLDSR